MSPNRKHLYRFGEFSLDTGENVLLHDGKPLALTPKMLELLLVLIKNHGRILGKDDLLETVWADSFVEEGNLKFNINQLRKVLKDDARHPLYIETVARRGYRFIAEVEEISHDTALADSAEKELNSRQTNNYYLPLIIAAAALIGFVALGIWILKTRNTATTAPIFSAPFAPEKLSFTGKVRLAAISPDGINVVYINQINGKESIWLRQLDSANNIEIIPPSADVYFGLTLSPTGDLLYFSRRPREFNGQSDIYRVSIFGGVPSKIISETQGWMSLSPDGAKISFVRCYYREEENCSLWLADSADGKNERKLTSRPRPQRISDNKFSPDGKSIAFAAGQSENQANEFGLLKIDLESGAESELSKEKFVNIKYLEWLPDQNGWLITARKNPERNFRIWQVNMAGDVQPLSKDSETYSVLSLDKNAARLVSTQVKEDSRLQLINAENPTLKQTLTNALEAAFAPDGKIFFSSQMTGNKEIWSINPDGGGQRQLTNNPADDIKPVASIDNNSIFFASNRTGAAHVWRMNTDGSNQTQVTNKEGGYPIFVSPDNQFVFYHHGITRTLWRVSLKTGEEQIILNKIKSFFAISPDGLQAAFAQRQNGELSLNIVSLANGQVVKTFSPTDKKADMLNIIWMPDGKNLAYISKDGDESNHSLYRQNPAEETPHLIFKLDDEISEAFGALSVSPDGKTFSLIQGGWQHDAVLLKGLK
jgi:Tol biopolymer transport system component/DNA-binding winged helix-turn-helix (wHTH) protein